MTPSPIVRYTDGRALVDRRTLARLSGRSVHTIRARCPVTQHHDGRALYDAEQCRQILAEITPRRRQAKLTPVS